MTVLDAVLVVETRLPKALVRGLTWRVLVVSGKSGAVKVSTLAHTIIPGFKSGHQNASIQDRVKATQSRACCLLVTTAPEGSGQQYKKVATTGSTLHTATEPGGALRPHLQSARTTKLM